MIINYEKNERERKGRLCFVPGKLQGKKKYILWKIIFYCFDNMGSREKIEKEILKKIV